MSMNSARPVKWQKVRIMGGLLMSTHASASGAGISRTMESIRTDCCSAAAIATHLLPLANHPGFGILGRELRPQGSVGGPAMVLSTEISRLVIFGYPDLAVFQESGQASVILA